MKIARVKADLTQQQLADEVGITRQTVSLIEKGKDNPSLKLCLKNCYAVNANLDRIFWINQKDFEWRRLQMKDSF
ncbi:helix-turn-helix transcriptional regulator [Bacillus thuringiensis]|uniref:helix-turn-helix transcriptional regulator n=1 Tax=Bacillus thuringiensis TaxID=1428 RepID=UPI000A35FF48|nr:helix-turn-helix transcriptional regulator [Bacillus thuringiensis]MDY8164090.1 helix-turn-helix transcriptional regulator [Bacillus thuringiensis]MED3068137.1 helix-turn-helix transcriptional regulator [Bacillus thuringiensis]OUB32353.1 transcriptional regulator [Bacillus thuringiensis serovar palmanyolensis]